jgi:hypothetical protein
VFAIYFTSSIEGGRRVHDASPGGGGDDRARGRETVDSDRRPASG